MISFLLFVFIAVSSAMLAGYALVAEHRRRLMLGRALGQDSALPPMPRAKLLAARRSAAADALRRRLGKLVPNAWVNDPATRQRLVRAGYDGEAPLFLFAVLRVGLLVLLPVATLTLGIGDTPLEKLFFLFGALVLSWIIPRGSLDSLVRRRQERIKRAIPDALDLLIVCVEAGSSLESAILRVSRDLAAIHPDLAFELGNVVRRTKAGVPRGEALRGLWDRTGVPELRTLAANIAQSERWGTSVGRVLRVTGETLRRKRRHSVERRAAMATVKMTVPLVTMILPPLFLVVLGPGVLQLIGVFHSAK
jgi:tight adherence protein C